MATAEIRRHWTRVRDLGCVITRNPCVDIHHCIGGSMKEAGFHSGMGQKASDWLVIPLNWQLHTGDRGVHKIGVLTWEDRYGLQMDHLEWVSRRLGYDVIARARGEE